MLACAPACAPAAGRAPQAALRLDAAPSFIDELRTLHSSEATSLKVALVAMLGLMGGAAMG